MPDLSTVFQNSLFGGTDAIGSDPSLNAFSRTIGQNDYWKLASAPILGAKFNTSTWDPGTTLGVTAAQSFLGSLLAGYGARQEAAQMDAVRSVLPQLRAGESVAVPEGVDPEAFAGLQLNYENQRIDNEAKSRSAARELLTNLALEEEKKKIDLKYDPLKARANKEAELGALGPDNPDLPGNKAAQKGLENIQGLRKEFNALEDVKDYSNVLQAASALSGALKDKGSVSDQELVRYSIQMIEPGLSVREGEQNAVKASQNISDEWKGQLNKTLESGTALGADVREGIKRLATRAYEAKKFNYSKALDYYQGQAVNKYGLAPDESISYLGAAPEASSIFGSPQPTGVSPDQRAAARAELRRLGVPGY